LTLQRAERGDRPDGLSGDRGDRLEVPVVVQNGELCALSRGRDQQVLNRYLPMMEGPLLGEAFHYVHRSAPDALAHRRGAQGIEPSSRTSEFVRCSALDEKLELDQVAGRDLALAHSCLKRDLDGGLSPPARPGARVCKLH